MNPLQKQANVKLEPFIFTAQTTIGIGAAGNITFNVDRSYNFYLKSFTWHATQAGVFVGVNPFTFNIRDNVNSVFSNNVSCLHFSGIFRDTATPLTTQVRQGDSPFQFKPARKFNAAGIIMVDMLNTSGAIIIVEFSLSGVKEIVSG